MRHFAYMKMVRDAGRLIDNIYVGPFESPDKAYAILAAKKHIAYIAPADPSKPGILRLNIGSSPVLDINTATGGYSCQPGPCHPSMRDAIEEVEKSLSRDSKVIETDDTTPLVLLGRVSVVTTVDPSWWIKMPTSDAVMCGYNGHGSVYNPDRFYIGPFENNNAAMNAVANIPIEWVQQSTMPGLSRAISPREPGSSDSMNASDLVELGAIRIMDQYLSRHMTEERANEVAAIMRAESVVWAVYASSHDDNFARI